MRQLEDGGLLVCANLFHNFKTALKQSFPAFIIPVSMIFVMAYGTNDWSVALNPMSWIMCLGIYISISILLALVLRLTAPTLTIYDQYISWKKEKYFFKDIQGFFVKTIIAHSPRRFGEMEYKMKVLYFVMKESQLLAPFYIYFDRISEQDRHLLVSLLTNKGLAHLPKDYKPNTI